MELKIKIGYRQVFELVNQLSDRDIQKLVKKIQDKSKTVNTERVSIQELILKSPTWTDKEYDNYLEIRNHINQSKLK